KRRGRMDAGEVTADVLRQVRAWVSDMRRLAVPLQWRIVAAEWTQSRSTADVQRQVRAWVSDMRRLAFPLKCETSRPNGGTQLASTKRRDKPCCARAAGSTRATAHATSPA